MPNSENDVLISLTTKKSIHAETVKWILHQDYAVDIVNTPNTLTHARNEQVERFLESPYKYLFILDSDCVPYKDIIKKLLSFNLPFVATPHPAIKGEETGLMVLDRIAPHKYKQHKPFDKGLQKCDAVGCAGMMIHKDVFKKIKKPYFEFIYDSNGLLLAGEDFNFCEKVQKAGLDIYAYCEDVQRHYVEVFV